MARQERPVDPGAGPLQAFAYDLRKVRVEAGNPTYRALARAAGYSATTLSEAANGLRKPTLEVVLAYVGACGGDVEDWRRRWHDLDDEVTRAAAAPTGPDEADETGPPARPTAPPAPDSTARRMPSGSGPTRRWRRPLAYGLAGALVAATATAGVVLTGDGGDTPVAAPTAGGCPPGPDASAAFTAETYGSGVHVRRGPARDHPVLYTVPPGCRIGLVGYCLGEKLIDGTAGTPDVRWYRLPDGGVLTSALVHGLPPAGMGPGTCHEGLPPPAAIGLTVRPAAKGRVRLAAAGPRVDVVGFAARFPADSALPDTRRWHQIALVDAAAGTDVDWAVPPVIGADPVPVVAVACLGGQGPTEVLDARSVRRDGRTVPTVLDGEQRAAAGRSACRYPDAG